MCNIKIPNFNFFDKMIKFYSEFFKFYVPSLQKIKENYKAMYKIINYINQ